ncbi:MAG: hypothetical protein GY849_20550 [Deltaproteobacteria bacterium]|nr:hypothetical protein [Deltaproteobacteria bacterium]
MPWEVCQVQCPSQVVVLEPELALEPVLVELEALVLVACQEVCQEWVECQE